MSIVVGESLPEVATFVVKPDGPMATSTGQVFANKRAVLFAVPGAFTPTCSARHLPGFVEKADVIFDKGVDLIACVSVNDAFVMAAWAGRHDAGKAITMIADGNGTFVRAIGLDRDMSERGMGYRSQRFAMVLADGVVEQLFVESAGGYGISSAENVLSHL
ncbi:MAG: redoxin family protein [Alphaproteobacteria bacterium]|nr:redoxin family protein [Alphaproteobacteria bacterium]